MGRRIKSINLRKPVPSVAGPGITEQYYFKYIRSLTEFNFKIKPQYFQTLTYTQFENIVEKELSDKRTIICVFDMDETRNKVPEKKKYQAFIQKYASNPLVIICESMPSIEYWFLLHYLNTNKYYFDAKTIERELRKYLKNYKKAEHYLENENWVKELCSDNKLNAAIERAKRFGVAGKSYSNIYKAFEKF